MERDLRETPLYREVEDFYRRALGPGSAERRTSRIRGPPRRACIAFRGTSRERLEGHPRGRICLAATTGPGLRQITNGPHDDDQPRWSPDGRTLTFRSDRAAEGNHQLYALDVDAIGEARPLPHGGGRRGAARVVARRHRRPGRGRRARGRAVRRGRLRRPSASPRTCPPGSPRSSPPTAPTDRRAAGDLWTIDVATGAVAAGVSRRAERLGGGAGAGTTASRRSCPRTRARAPGTRARLVVIDLAPGPTGRSSRADVQLGWVIELARRRRRRGGRGALQRPLGRRRRPPAGRPDDGERRAVDTSRRRRRRPRLAGRRGPVAIGVRGPGHRGAGGRRRRPGPRTERWATSEAVRRALPGGGARRRRLRASRCSSAAPAPGAGRRRRGRSRATIVATDARRHAT